MTISLTDRVAQSTVSDVNLYLRGLADKSEKELFRELNQSDSKGMMPLPISIEKADVQMVKLLLSFDAPVSAKVGNKTMEEYAKALITQEPKDNRKQVYALIKSRGRWQSSASKDQGIEVSRSMREIEEATHKIQGTEGRAGVLFLGITGEGKSTFINYLAGTEYQIKKVDKRKFIAEATGTEIAKVGHSTTSATYLPQSVEIKDKTYVLVDLPGFEDTRGIAEEICAAASICMLTKQLRTIHAIAFVVSWTLLSTDTRMTTYRKAAHNVGAMINQNPDTAQNVVLIVTKPDQDLDEGEIRAKLEELAKAEKWSATNPRLKNEDITTEDMWKNQCLRNATEAILNNKGNIIIADITNKTARVTFQNMIDGLEKKSKKTDQFNFSGYSNLMKRFQIVVESMLIHYNGLAREIVNKINTMRREADFAVTDRIKVSLETTDRVKNCFQKYNETICHEVLAVDVQFGKSQDGVEWDLNGEPAKIAIARVT